jgi:uncharacterized protein (TIGR03086 family)
MAANPDDAPKQGINFVEELVHGWDLATATNQDATIPDDLATAAFEMVNGRMDSDGERGSFFASRLDPPANASAQEKLLAYTGREPR